MDSCKNRENRGRGKKKNGAREDTPFPSAQKVTSGESFSTFLFFRSYFTKLLERCFFLFLKKTQMKSPSTELMKLLYLQFFSLNDRVKKISLQQLLILTFNQSA
jgi:hypothetical protein